MIQFLYAIVNDIPSSPHVRVFPGASLLVYTMLLVCPIYAFIHIDIDAYEDEQTFEVDDFSS